MTPAIGRGHFYAIYTTSPKDTAIQPYLFGLQEAATNGKIACFTAKKPVCTEKRHIFA